MPLSIKIGDAFPNAELPDHTHGVRKLSQFTAASQLDQKLNFKDGYPLIVVFYRGYFCPRDQQQFRLLVQFQSELQVNYCGLVSIAVQSPEVQAAFRAGLGASWTFLADTDRKIIKQLGIVDSTEGEYADVSRPFTFVLNPDLTVHKIYDGWYFVGRPTLEELRQDLRAIMQNRSYYAYEHWDTPNVKQIRIPQAGWRDQMFDDTKASDAGVILTFDHRSGNGTIKRDGNGEVIFFNFTAIPGEGYRTVSVGTRVRFEIVDNPTGRSARNIQKI